MKKTFTAKLLFLNALLALTFTACNNNDDPDDIVDPVTGTNTCQLVKEVYEGDDDFTEFEYNAQGYITKAVFKEVGSSASSDYLTFSYNANNQLVKTEYFDNGVKEDYSTYEYTNDLLTAAKSYSQNGTLNNTTTYKYDSSKRMIEEESEGDIHKYTYDSKNNVVKIERVYQNMVISRETFENFDDKISPYASVKGFPLALSEASPNNPGKTVSTYDDNQDGILQPSESETTTYTYKYNDKGFTTEIKEMSGSDTEISTFTYNCK